MIAMLGLGGLELLLILPMLALGVAGTAFWIWMLVDCALNEPSEGNEKVVWILVILFAHLVGALIYFFGRRPRRLTPRP